MKTILVTGANGQLGKELAVLAPEFPAYQFIFCNRQQLDITDYKAIADFFTANSINFVINCAAYTQVDKAESEPDLADLINHQAVKNLAKVCAEHKAVLIQISTDFVFGGNKNTPFKEKDSTNPVGVYAATKLLGEQAALQHNPATIVIRTSWVYSTFGHNFVKTMLRLGNKLPQIGVVFDQVGSPTYARDLAQAILQIIEQQEKMTFGEIYHYTNSGVISWFDFATTIMKTAQLVCQVNPIESHEYPTPAQRPAYSVMNTKKISQQFNITIPYWRDSFEECLEKLLVIS